MSDDRDNARATPWYCVRLVIDKMQGHDAEKIESVHVAAVETREQADLVAVRILEMLHGPKPPTEPPEEDTREMESKARV